MDESTRAVDGARRIERDEPRGPDGEAAGFGADLGALPVRRATPGGPWADRVDVDVPRPELPLALWELHRSLRVGAPVRLRLFAGDADHDPRPDDPSGGRGVARWDPDHLAAVVIGAGFGGVTVTRRPGAHGTLVVEARRDRTLADTVGGGMRVLVVGLNPSWYAADRGVPFARGGNRFWPAAQRAGLVSCDRDPLAALRDHGVGLTDLVKRPSRRAAEISVEEFRAGLARVERLVDWLEPRVVCVVGITGWRSATGDRRAQLGRQPRGLGGRPVHVVPNPSGLNAHTSVDDLAGHLRAAVDDP